MIFILKIQIQYLFFIKENKLYLQEKTYKCVFNIFYFYIFILCLKYIEILGIPNFWYSIVLT